MIKSFGKIRNSRPISKHNKSNIQQTTHKLKAEDWEFKVSLVHRDRTCPKDKYSLVK
jgi:dsRNA-specific ribonuclease